MREIKFRAWYPAECWADRQPRMVQNVFISNKGKSMSLEGGWDYMGDDEKAIVMQYTGLKDKNGVEIYEGDIISGMMYDKTFPNNTVVMFDQRYAVFKGQNGTQLIPLGYECRVIGNIYQNPELLTNKEGK